MTEPPAPHALLTGDERSSRYDRFRARLAGDAALARRIEWIAPLLVTLLAAALRLANLGNPHALVFDETYYVKDAWSQWGLGYPANWPSDADESFAAGDTDIYLSEGSFVVHPPLGKFLIGLGMWLFGADSSFGWRIAVAVFGTATVLLVYLVARTLTRSVPLATVAATFMAIDGLGIVLSRVALLDGILTFFILLAFWFVLLDARGHRRRMTAIATPAGDARPDWGPLIWNRPWVIAAGAAAGAACAVKWSGLYALAGLGIYLVVADAIARWRAGVRLWAPDALRQGVASFLLLVPVAFIVYLASWTGWLLSDGGYDRHVADDDPATGLFSWVPLALQSLWRYHEAIYDFHVNLHAEHSYASPAWQWPLLVRPTSMYWEQSDGTVQAISSIANPLIWWGGVIAVLSLVYHLVRRVDGASAFVLTGVVVTYVPWLLYPERTIFQFYTVAIAPFLCIALAMGLREIAGAASRDPIRRMAGQRVVIVFLVAVVALSAFWYPVWTAMPVSYDFWRLHNWVPTWI